MTISAAITWEVQSGGNDLNGGGFKTGATGTDYSTSTSAHTTFNGTTVTATTSGTSATMTLSGYTVAAGDVGNVLNIASGTNFTAGLYEITSVNTGAGTWTVDRNCSSGAGSALVGRMGGCFATPAQAFAAMTVSGQTIYIKAATYSVASAITYTVAGTNVPVRVIGYTSSRGDGGQATIQASADGFTMLTTSGSTANIKNIIFDGNSHTTLRLFSGPSSTCTNCVFKNASNTDSVVHATLSSVFVNCEVSSNTLVTTDGIGVIDGGKWLGCYVHGNTTATLNSAAFFFASSNDSVTHSVIYNNAGMRGVVTARNVVLGNYIDANGSDGVYIADVSYNVLVMNNIISNNGGYGVNTAFAATAVLDGVNYNAYYNNTSGARNSLSAGPNDVTLTGNAYTSSGSNFAPNTTQGAGAACRNAGYPGTIVANGTGYADIGPLRHDSGGGSFTFS